MTRKMKGANRLMMVRKFRRKGFNKKKLVKLTPAERSFLRELDVLVTDCIKRGAQVEVRVSLLTKKFW